MKNYKDLDQDIETKVNEFRKKLASRIYPQEEKTKTGAGIFGIAMISAAVGALVALFTSPNSGKENQKLAKQKAAELKNKAQDSLNEFSHKTENLTEDAKDKANEVKNKAQNKWDKIVAKFEDWKANAEDKKNELEARFEDDTDELRADTRKAADKVADRAHKVVDDAKNAVKKATK